MAACHISYFYRMNDWHLPPSRGPFSANFFTKGSCSSNDSVFLYLWKEICRIFIIFTWRQDNFYVKIFNWRIILKMEFDLDICHYLRKNIEYMPRRHNPHLTYVKTVEPNLTADKRLFLIYRHQMFLHLLFKAPLTL